MVTGVSQMLETSSQEPGQIAELLLEKNTFVTLPDTEEILRYEDGVYLPGGETFIKSRIQRNVSDVSKHLCEEAIAHVQRSSYRKRSDFDDNPMTLVLENCLFDLETFEMQAHSPEYLSRVKLPVSYDPLADCPRITRFLGEVMYPEDIPVAQEFVGYCLWKRYDGQKAVMLVGEGSNGKSTLISIIKALLGIQNISSRGLQELELNRFAKADLYGKLANLYADLPDTALKSTGTFKMLTGGDPISAEYKFRNAFPFVNYAKLIFSANKVPEVYEDTTAFFRRWIILTFPNRFEGDKENKNLLQELETPEELSGFLNWALDGLKRLKANSWRFSNSKSTDQVRDEYIRKSSPIQAFLDDRTKEASDAYVVKQDLYSAFTEYCRTNKLPAVTQQTFFHNLPIYVRVETVRKEIGGRRSWCFTGLRLKEGREDEEDGSQQRLRD